MRLCVRKENDCINLANLCWKRYLSCVTSHVYSSTACIFWVHDWREVCVEGIFCSVDECLAFNSVLKPW